MTTSQPIPIILDTDIGSDIDDLWALCTLLGSPEFDLRLLSTCDGDVERRAQLAARVLERAGRSDVPVSAGARRQGERLRHDAWLEQFNDPPPKVLTDAPTRIIETTRKSEQTLVLCAIGPMDNVAEVVRRGPDLRDRIRIVSMGGSIRRGWQGREGASREHNVNQNPAAARTVLTSGWDVTLVPLDVCATLRVSGDDFRSVAESRHPLARIVMENLAVWKERENPEEGWVPDGCSSVLFDCVALHCVLDESVCEMADMGLRVTDDGYTLPDAAAAPVRAALECRKPEAVQRRIVDALTGALG